MKSMKYFGFIILLLSGCNNSSKKSLASIGKNDSIENIFILDKINLDSCLIIDDPDNHQNFYVIKKDGKFGLINNKRLLVLPTEFDSIKRPHLADYYLISKNNLFGVVTSEGYLTIPILYEHIEYDWKDKKSGEKDCFIVQKNKKLGSIDFYNNTIIPIEFDGISNWVEYGPDAHYVKKDDKYGIVNYNTGKLIIPVEYDGIEDYRGLIEVKKNNKYGILSWDNTVIIPCIYDKIYVDLDFFGFENNHKDRIFAQKNNIWYEFLVSGKLIKSNVPTNKIKRDFWEYEPDINEYRYHLVDCMVFPN